MKAKIKHRELLKIYLLDHERNQEKSNNTKHKMTLIKLHFLDKSSFLMKLVFLIW